MKKKGNRFQLDPGELPNLPIPWRWGRLEDAATKDRNAIVDGPFGSNLKLTDYVQPPGVPVLTTANLRGDYSPERLRYISQKKFAELKRSEVRGGDILVAKIGSCGLTGIYPEHLPSAIIPANLLKMTVDSSFSRKFVFYYLNSPLFARFLKLIITATAQPAFNVSKFRQLPLPLIPRPEQDQIVSEIEKQFTRLEAGVVGLRRVQANLKRYRAAVLKAACEGKLVPTEAELARQEGRSYETGAQLLERILSERRRKWNGKGKYKDSAKPDTANLPPLPEGWAWARLDAIAALKGGITVDKNRKLSTARSVPYLRVANVQRGYLDLSEVKEIDAPENDIGELQLIPGDILFTEGGDRDKLGRGWVWKGQISECIHQNHVFRARLFSAGIEPRFVSWWGNSFGQRHFLREGKQTTNLASINLSKLSQFPIPIPPSHEQQRIAGEVERRLSVVEELETVVNADIQRAVRLRQAILQQAFDGQLFAPEREQRIPTSQDLPLAAESSETYGQSR